MGILLKNDSARFRWTRKPGGRRSYAIPGLARKVRFFNRPFTGKDCEINEPLPKLNVTYGDCSRFDLSRGEDPGNLLGLASRGFRKPVPDVKRSVVILRSRDETWSAANTSRNSDVSARRPGVSGTVNRCVRVFLSSHTDDTSARDVHRRLKWSSLW
jgi:hypothetical protein